ncbi:MAG: amidohydrolase/deacetylase family metallohydrolase, partial [Rhodospirillaceae bacterium]
MTEQDPRYDWVIEGGEVIDPATGLRGRYDLGLRDGRIAALEPDLSQALAAERFSAKDLLVVPGLIDTHAHVYQHVTGRFGLAPDLVGVQSGVTTIVDQGGPSCMTIGGYRHFIHEPSQTRALCFISAYLVGGLEGHYYPELYGPGGVNAEHTIRVARENLDLVKGVKAHAELGGQSRWGLDVIRVGKEISSALGLP